MATLLNIDGTIQDITLPDPEGYYEQIDMERILGGPICVVSAKDGHLLIIREYPEGTEPAAINPQAESYFDVWPILGPAVHCFRHEWFTDQRERFHYLNAAHPALQTQA